MSAPAPPPAAAGPSAGRTSRVVQLDESLPTWRARAGRAAGAETYEHGDLAHSILRETAAMGARQRNDAFGGPALLVAVLEARGLMPLDANGKSDPYATVLLLDELGRELREVAHGHGLGRRGAPVVHMTRTVPETTSPDWDEVFTLGQHNVDVAAAAGKAAPRWLRVKLSDYDSPSVKEKPEGVVDIDLRRVREEADIEHGGAVLDAWFDVTPDPSSAMDAKALAACNGRLGRLHLMLLYHAPPPDPRPLSLAVRVSRGVDMLVADSNGFSDPYAKVKLGLRGGGHVMRAAADGSAARRVAELVTDVKYVTLNPVWEEVLVFNDAQLEHADVLVSAGGGGGAAGGAAAGSAAVVSWGSSAAAGALEGPWGANHWGWRPAAPPGLAALPLQQATVAGLGAAVVLQVVLKDRDFGKTDDDIGEVVLRLSSLFGDEDAVVCGNTLRVDKWFRVRPHKSMPPSLEGHLGYVHLDIVMRFAEELLPAPWVEAVDCDSGDSYFYNAETQAAQWTLPVDLSGGAAPRDAVRRAVEADVAAIRVRVGRRRGEDVIQARVE